MRILRLIKPDSYAIELHPYVTVVTGLDDDQRDEIRAAIADATAGRTPTLTGLIEAHGMVLDLDGTALGLLELDGVEADVVVTGDDLPGAASTGIGRQLRTAERRLVELDEPQLAARRRVEEAEQRADTAHQALHEARAAADAAQVDDAEAAALQAIDDELRQAERTVESLAEPASRAAGALQQAERAVEVAEHRRAELADESPESLSARRVELGNRRASLTDAIDERAADSLDNALAELADARAALEQAEAAAAARHEAADQPRPRADDPSGEEDDDESRLEEEEEEEEEEDGADEDDADAALDTRIEEIRGTVALHESFDPEPVHAALDAVRLTPAEGALVPSPEAIGIAQRLEELARHVQAFRSDEDDAAPLPGVIDAATARLDELRSRVVELERAEPRSEGPEADIAELERVHAEVVEAREGVGGRLGRNRSQKRLDTALAAEQAVLERLGFSSYTDFMTGGRASLAAPAESDALRQARAEAREAELELRELLEAVDRDLARTEAIEDLRTVQRQGQALVADPQLEGQALVEALLDLRVPSAATTPIQELQTALAGVGLSTQGLDLSTDDVIAMAADWLDEYHRAEERRAVLVAELADLQRQLGGELGEAAPRPTPPQPPAEPTPAFAMPEADDGPAEPAGPDASDASIDDVPGPVDEPESAPDTFAAGQPFVLPYASDADLDEEPAPETEPEPEQEQEPEPEPEPVAETGSEGMDDDDEVAACRSVVEDAEARVEAAKARVIEHEAAARELDEIDAELASLAQRMTDVDEVADLVDDAVAAVEAATAEYEQIERTRVEAEHDIARLRAELDARRQAVPDGPPPEQVVAEAESAVVDADEALRAAREALDAAREDYDAAAVEVAALRQAVAELDQQDAPVEEIEWYLLARLAGQRHVSFAGSVPLVVDRALDAVAVEGKAHLLDRLERMAGAVQVVHLSDDPEVLAWAREAGDERVGVVSPVKSRDALPADG